MSLIIKFLIQNKLRKKAEGESRFTTKIAVKAEEMAVLVYLGNDKVIAVVIWEL